MPPREIDLHVAVCRFISLKYPNVLFFSDGSGLRMSIGLAKQFKRLRSSNGVPDLFIAEPRGEYFGAFIEIKKKDAGVFLKDGTLSKNKHVREQAAVLDHLSHKGYFAAFGIGLDHCCKMVDEYLDFEEENSP